MERRAVTVAATLLCTTLLFGAAAALTASGAAAQEPVREVTREAAPPAGSADAVVAADGTRTLYAGPVRVQRDGEWRDVDLTLRAGADGVVRPVASPQDLTLTAAGPSVRYAAGGEQALAWPTPLPAPALDGPTATYPQAAPGYDLEVEATRTGFVASVRRAGTPTTPPPPLRLTGKAGTEAESAVDRVVAAAPPTGTVPFDTTAQTTVRNSDTSGDPDLRLGSYDGVEKARAYVTFDLATLSAAPVGRATLELYQTWSASCRASAWEVWSVPAPVGPTLRWTNQPAPERLWATSTDTRGNAPACAAGWSTVDVTDLVRSWVAAGATSGTVVLKAADETDRASWKRFASAETATVPHLTITP